MERQYRQCTLFFLGTVIAVAGWLQLPLPGMPGAHMMLHSNLWAETRIIEVMEESASPALQAAERTDSQLVAAAAGGDQGAFHDLYQRHAGRLMPMLWRLAGGDHALAEDFLQDAFVQAWHKLDQVREPERFGGWLRQLAVNVALADRRRLRVAGTDEALAFQAEPEPPWPSADTDLENAIARLPDRARQVLVLFCIEGYSHEEISQALKIETGTSKAQLHRARGLLREVLS